LLSREKPKVAILFAKNVESGAAPQAETNGHPGHDIALCATTKESSAA